MSIDAARQILRLAALAHEAAFDSSAWAPFLEQLTSALGARGAGLLHHEVNGSLIGTVVHSVGLDPEATSKYGEYYGSCDPWALELRRQRRFDDDYVVTGESLVSFTELKRTEFYNDFARYYDVVRNVGIGVRTDPGVATTITVLRGAHQSPFDESAVQVIRELQPHIRAALRVHRRLTRAERRASLGEAAVEQLPTGVMILDERGVAAFVNSEGRRIVAMNDGLTLSRGRPAAHRHQDTRRLQNVIDALLRPSSPQDARRSALRLGRPSGRPDLSVVLASIPLRCELGDSILMFVSDPMGHGLDESILAQQYGFTSSEARVAAALAQGKSIREIAGSFGIAVNTVRWRIRQILQKAGVESVPGFLSLLTRSVNLRSSRPF